MIRKAFQYRVVSLISALLLTRELNVASRVLLQANLKSFALLTCYRPTCAFMLHHVPSFSRYYIFNPTVWYWLI